MDEKQKALKNTHIFKSLDGEELNMLAEITEEKSFESGETIIKMNESGSSMFIIQTGGVNIYYRGGRSDEFMLRHLAEGEMFGEMSIFDNEPRSALVKATWSTKVFEIQKDRLFDLVEVKLSRGSARSVLIGIIEKLCERLRFTSNDLYISMGVGRQLTQQEIDELIDELNTNPK